MENPMYWTRVERVIHEARMEWERDRAVGRCGYSLEALVANALREAGLIKEDDG